MMIEKLPRHCGGATAVAVIGIHGRFPGAKDVRTLWANLGDGVDPITEIPVDRWRHQEIFGEPDGDNELTYATMGGFAPNVDAFDCKFFNITPREAESMDPQQRLVLQTSWGALEDAGIPPSGLAGKPVGVFFGVGYADYPVLMRRDSAPFDVFRGTGITTTAITNRVSFSLDLRGPSEIIDTACSGSLVAIHRANQAIACGDCELAIAGGVNLLLGPELFIAFAKAGMLSRTGRCRPFDKSADGYVRSEGVAAVVLKPLHLAEADGDFIYGVIRGSAENHGGKTHSFTAPSVQAQSEVVSRAWARSGLAMREACLIETHGTGTRLGDPIEIKGLVKALEGASPCGPQSTDNRIALGALKSNVGHLEAAAGITGVLKTLMCLQQKSVPANLHFNTVNPEIKLGETPFDIPVQAIDLRERAQSKTLTAGVSSFGFGGSNAHVVLESYTSASRADDAAAAQCDSPRLIVLSARDAGALRARAVQLATFLACSEGTTRPGLLDAVVGRRLGLGAPASACGPVRLSALGLNAADLSRALDEISQHFNLRVGLTDVRDCVTVAEVFARIEALVGVSASTDANPTDHGDYLLTQPAVPEEILRGVTLASISYTLLHGRDVMDERVAFVVDSTGTLRTMLAQFLASGEAAATGWHRGIVRRGAAATLARPALSGARASLETLSEWAQYWVSTPGSPVAWQDLHDEPRPGKIPLPSYPFKLVRIWYQRKAHAPANAHTGHVSNAATPARAAIRQQTFEVRPARLDSAIASLSAAVMHLSRRSRGASVRISEIKFGTPLTADLGKLSIRESANPTGAIQCVSDRGGQSVALMQGRAAIRGEIRAQTLPIIEGNAWRLESDAFRTLLQSQGVRLGDASELVDDVACSDDAFLFRLRPTGTSALATHAFVSDAVALITAAAAALPTRGGTGLRAPSRLSLFEFDPTALDAPFDVLVRRESSAVGFEAFAVTADAVTVLALRGLHFSAVDGAKTADHRGATAILGPEVALS